MKSFEGDIKIEKYQKNHHFYNVILSENIN